MVHDRLWPSTRHELKTNKVGQPNDKRDRFTQIVGTLLTVHASLAGGGGGDRDDSR